MYEHVSKKDKKCVDYEVEAVRPRGRTKKTWSDIVGKDHHIRQMCREDAVDCSKWRKLIKDIV